jgi:hypothetical protein
MRADLLSFVLRDEYSYQDTTKETFLEKLEQLFLKHKAEGDKKLLIHPGQCAGVECDNCGKRGYRFVGDHTGNFINFIFISDGDEVTDIFDCVKFKTDQPTEPTGEMDSFDFDDDDKVTFIKTPEYWSKAVAAQDAFREIVTSPPRLLDYDDVCYWLDKHADLNFRIGDYFFLNPNMKWSPFSKLYATFIKYRFYISTYEFETGREYNAIKAAKTDEEKIAWVFRNEEIFENAPGDFRFFFSSTKRGYRLNRTETYILTGKHFRQAFRFLNTYERILNALLEKYNTFTYEEFQEALRPDRPMSDDSNIFSLKFHLDRRKALQEVGIQIPFYLITEKGIFSTFDSNFL